MPMDLREQKFGIEIELTGLTRKRAAEVIGKYLGQEPHYDGGYYEEYSVRDGQGRKWKVMYDSSIVAVKKGGGSAGDEYKVEFVSPICEYADIPTIQELVRQLRPAGAIAGENPCSCECSTLYGKNTPQHYKHHVLQGGSDL